MTAVALELRSRTQVPPVAPRGEGVPSRAETCDEALAQRAQLGGNDAVSSFGVLVERYEGRIVSFLARRAGSRHDAEDLAQEAFLRAWTKIGTYDPSRRFSVWLFTVAARVATSEWRKRKEVHSGQRTTDSGNQEARPERGAAWSAAERVLDAETMSAVWLRYAGGLEPSEIAAVLGRTSVGVRVMLHRARKKIAAELADWTPGRQDARMPRAESEQET